MLERSTRVVAGDPSPADRSPASASEPAARSPSDLAGRLRWLVAIGVSAIVVAGSIVVAALLGGGVGPSGLLARTPGDSAVYAELRLDLPGDQRAKLGRFLAHVPGFADQALLETKLDDLLDRAIGALSDGRLRWAGGIDTWFGGEAAVVIRHLPRPGDSATGLPVPLVLATVTDPAAARTWVTTSLDALGLPWVRDTLAGSEVVLVGGSVDRRAIAVTDDLLIGGRAEDVAAALETTPATSLGAAARTNAAAAALAADHLAWLYVDGVAYRGWLSTLAGTGTIAAALGERFIPEWLSLELRADGDAAVVEAALPLGGRPAAEGGATRLASLVPKDVVAFAAVAGLGSLVRQTVADLRADPALAPSLEALLAALDRVGGLETLTGWIDGAALVVGVDGDAPWWGVVAVPRDRALAETLAASLENLARLALPDVRIDEDSADGTTIVWLEVGPGGVADGPGGRVTVAWAVTDTRVVVAPEPSTVRRVLAAGPGTSLADEPRYATLVERAGGSDGSRVAFVDLRRLRTVLEARLDLAARARYERDVRPYLAPFDAVAVVDRVDGALERGLLVVGVEQIE